MTLDLIAQVFPVNIAELIHEERPVRISIEEIVTEWTSPLTGARRR
jgi:hypothetical protein